MKGAHRRPQVYHLLLLSRVTDIKCGFFTFTFNLYEKASTTLLPMQTFPLGEKWMVRG